MRVDGFAMLYTGLVFWRASPPVLSPTRGLKAITTKGRVLPVGVNCRAGRDPAGEANHLASLFLGIELISLPLFGWSVTLSARNVRWKPVSNTPSLCRSVFFPAVWYGAGVCAVGDLSFVALGKNLGDGMLNEPCCWQVSD